MPKITSLSASQPTLYLMLGLPGSGKSVTGKAIANITGASYILSDQIMKRLFPEPKFIPEEYKKMMSVLFARMHGALCEGKSVVIDANNNRRDNRKRQGKIAANYGANMITVFVTTPEHIAKQRAQTERDEQSFFISDEVFDRFKSRMQPPFEAEDYIVIDGTLPVAPQLHALFAGADS